VTQRHDQFLGPPLGPSDARPWFRGARRADVSGLPAPLLLVVVDTEEEFDWSAPFDRANTSVRTMASIGTFQSLCDEFGVVPTYVIDQAIAAQPAGYELLAQYHADGRANIGAHLHAWVTPPFEEDVNSRNSFQGNLPRSLERAKLAHLTETIQSNLGVRCVVHKAGRYGFGPNTAGILDELGYRIDCSVSAAFDWSAIGGPDFQHFSNRPFWFGADLLELPASGAIIGRAPLEVRRRIYAWASRPSMQRLRAGGLLSRLGLAERILLSPEGHSFEDLARLVRAELRSGERVLTLTLHSPSFVPGHTPYVRNHADLHEFLTVTRRFFEYFLGPVSLGALGGRASTPFEVAQLLRSPQPSSTL
jgi:hypothetical protein